MKTYIRFLTISFLKSFINIFLIMLSLVLILNLLSELDFFKDIEVGSFFPAYLALLNSGSLIFEMFPFICLVCTQFFFIGFFKDDQLNIFKYSGLKNTSIIKILSLLTFLIGVFVIIFFYNFTSNLKNFYLELKSNYTSDDKYLAVVTGNGLWIRDQVGEFVNYINAEKLENDNLYNVTISQFDKNFDLEKVIISEKANIKTNNWILERPIVNSQNNSLSFDKLEFFSNFDEDRMLSIFDNLSSLDLFQLEALKKDYEMLGYNTEMINGYKHRLYSYPLYLALMVCIGSILMLNIKHNKSKVVSVTFGIIISVVIYYINYFFNVIIETKDVPYLMSIWGPQIILSLIVITNLIRINEK